MKTACKEQSKAIMYAHFVISVILKAVLYYEIEVLQFKKYVSVGVVCQGI